VPLNAESSKLWSHKAAGSGMVMVHIWGLWCAEGVILFCPYRPL
jgi:hypothetical protein